MWCVNFSYKLCFSGHTLMKFDLFSYKQVKMVETVTEGWQHLPHPAGLLAGSNVMPTCCHGVHGTITHLSTKGPPSLWWGVGGLSSGIYSWVLQRMPTSTCVFIWEKEREHTHTHTWIKDVIITLVNDFVDRLLLFPILYFL